MEKVEEEDRRSYYIALRDSQNSTVELRPPAGVRWGGELSVCERPGSKQLAVSDYDSWTLSLYTAEGKYQQRHHTIVNRFADQSFIELEYYF